MKPRRAAPVSDGQTTEGVCRGRERREFVRSGSRIGLHEAGQTPHDLQRFVQAQRDTYDGVLDELRRGRKESHWIWFIFPQIAGLGRSATSQRFAIRSLDEAIGYLAHPLLGARLRECSRLLLAITGRTADEILGPTDAVKVRSCMTLFHWAARDEPLFVQVVDRFYGGVPDEATDTLLR